MTTKKVTNHTTHAGTHEETVTSEGATTTTKHPPAKPHSTTVPVSAAPVAPAPGPGSVTVAEIQQFIAQLDAMTTLLGSSATPLSIEERRQQPKMKKGGEKQIPDVLNLADRYKVSIPGGGTAEARTALALALALQPLATRVAAMSSLVDDAILQANSTAWETTTTLYSMLVRLVKRFPALQGELQPMASFMARVHKDAPTNLRRAEATTLAKGRATRKATKAKAATTTSANSAPAVATAAPATPAAPSASGAVAPVQPSPAVAPANRSN
jgi:hypothetical protein